MESEGRLSPDFLRGLALAAIAHDDGKLTAAAPGLGPAMREALRSTLGAARAGSRERWRASIAEWARAFVPAISPSTPLPEGVALVMGQTSNLPVRPGFRSTPQLRDLIQRYANR